MVDVLVRDSERYAGGQRGHGGVGEDVGELRAGGVLRVWRCVDGACFWGLLDSVVRDSSIHMLVVRKP